MDESASARVPHYLSGRAWLAAKEPLLLEGGTGWCRRRSPARPQRLALRAPSGDGIVTVDRWSSEELFERDVVVGSEGSLGVRRRVLRENWGVILVPVERIGGRALRIG